MHFNEIDKSTPHPAVARGIIAACHRPTPYRAIVARDHQARHDAYALRYASYLDGGFIASKPERLFRDHYDDLPNADTIIVYESLRPVASVRVCFLSDRDPRSPARDAFPQALKVTLENTTARKTETKAAEITRLVRSPDSGNNQGLVFLLYRLAGHLVLRRDVQVILSSVRSNHVPFYRRLGFFKVGEPRAYPGLSCPMSLLQCSRAAYDRTRAGFELIDPEATPPGVFDGFEHGRVITMPLSFSDRADA